MPEAATDEPFDSFHGLPPIARGRQTIEPPEPPKPEAMDVVLAAFAALGYALSARSLLFLSLLGAFVLGVFAMVGTSWMRLAILCAYGILTVIPCAWLEVRRRE